VLRWRPVFGLPGCSPGLSPLQQLKAVWPVDTIGDKFFHLLLRLISTKGPCRYWKDVVVLGLAELGPSTKLTQGHICKNWSQRIYDSYKRWGSLLISSEQIAYCCVTVSGSLGNYWLHFYRKVVQARRNKA
jgi:hypothetical protein